MGHSVRIFTSSKIHNTEINMISGKEPYLEQEMDGVEYTFVRSSDYHGNGLSRIKNMLEFPRRVRKVCKQFPLPDVIYTSSPDLFTALAAVRMARRKKIPVVVEIRDLWPESIVDYKGLSRKNPVIRVLYRLEKWIYEKADCLIFTMEGGKEYIQDRGWEKEVDLQKVFHVNNGVDLKEFDRNASLYTLDDPDLCSGNFFRVAYTGSIREANGVGFMIDAAKILQEKKQNVLFLIYGDGTEKAALEQRLKDEDIRNVRFKGRVEKKYIPFILSKSDLNLLNCQPVGIWNYGGSQNKLFEYFASGKPVLTNISMRFDLIEKYHAGTSLESSTPELLAKEITEFLSMDPETYGQYCKNARQAAEDYDFTVLTQKLLEVLQRAVNP